MPPIIGVEGVHFTYPVESGKPPPPALSGVDLMVGEGEYLAIVGGNG